VTERIRVHEKALAHLSKGLYRSPASAIRELISNAWDAGATQVEVTTGAPVFAQLVVTDNGRGFGRAEFTRLMSGGIGNSEKRSALQPASVSTRPIIGRLGIGLMGVAQLCTRFQVISRTKEGASFAAEVRILSSLRRKLDADDPAVVAFDRSGQEEVFIGEWDTIPPPEWRNDWHGTQIILTDLLPSLVATFAKTLKPVAARIDAQDQEMADRVDQLVFPSPAEMKEALPPRDWQRAVQAMSEKESVTVRGAYWRFLWELAAACPVPYLDSNVVPDKRVHADQKRLLDFDFTVRIDGRELRKPILFSERRLGFSTVGFERSIEVDGRPLKFHGYLAVQDGSQLRPAEIRGVQIRIKDVGVGYYDGTLLDWQVNQGPRSRWISGEVFVELGLEDALNVDRDSFNRFHPEFIAVQAAVHAELKKVFTGVYRKMTSRSKQRREERTTRRRDQMIQVLESQVDSGRVSVRDLAVAAESVEEIPLLVRRGKRDTVIAIGSQATLGLDESTSLLVHSIVALYDLLQSDPKLSPSKRRQRFVEGLADLLREW
jgi:hypothetical protein